MTSELVRIDTEMKSVVDNLEKSISRLKGKQNDDKRLDRCTQLIKRLGGLIESFKLDVVSMDDSDAEKKNWEVKLVQYEARLAEMKVEFNERRREVEKKLLLNKSPHEGEKLKNLTGEEDVTTLDKQQALYVGDVMLDKAAASLARAKKLAVESEQVGLSTLGKMEEQNEQMERMYEDFDDIDSNIARSKRLLGHIAQAAVNDRCVQVLATLVFIAVVVVFVQLFKGGEDAAPTAVPALRRLANIVIGNPSYVPRIDD